MAAINAYHSTGCTRPVTPLRRKQLGAPTPTRPSLLASASPSLNAPSRPQPCPAPPGSNILGAQPLRALLIPLRRYLLPDMDYVFISGSAFVNKTMPLSPRLERPTPSSRTLHAASHAPSRRRHDRHIFIAHPRLGSLAVAPSGAWPRRRRARRSVTSQARMKLTCLRVRLSAHTVVRGPRLTRGDAEPCVAN